MKLIILDRDGVINQDSDDYIRSAEEWQPIPGSLEAIAKLNLAGYTVVIITNQSGVGRGYFSSQDLTAMHQKMRALLNKHHGKIDKIYYCPHTPHDNCTCRKPKTGMFEQVADDYKIDLPSAINIGDSLRDLQAGQLMGCQNILVKTGKGTKTFKELEKPNNIKVFANLSKAVDYILNIS